MTGHTVEEREAKLRARVLEVLACKRRASAREIGYELQVYGIQKSPREVAGFILGDPVLKEKVEADYEDFGGWKRLTFSLTPLPPDRRPYNMRCQL